MHDDIAQNLPRPVVFHDGGTRLTDRVRYTLPPWLPTGVERRLHRHFVAPRLARIFDYRAAVFTRLFGEASHPNTSGDTP